MDGVLVDVSASYRKAIQETVRFFSEKPALAEEIQLLKEKGGYNNDWDLTQSILRQRGKNPHRGEIVQKFQELYLGSDGIRGFIENENWLLPREELATLHASHCLGIVTGRPRFETKYVLKKFNAENFFDVVVAMEDYAPEKAKPDPTPIRLALDKLGSRKSVYVGDSVDDIAAAKNAGIRAFGCIPPGCPTEPLTKLLLKRGAERVLGNIREIENALQ